MSKVFIVAPHDRFDFTPAQEHGDIVYLLQRHELVSPLRTQELFTRLKGKLHENGYEPSVDKVVVSGNGALLALAVMAVASMTEPGGSAMLLIFDAANERYVERKVTL